MLPVMRQILLSGGLVKRGLLAHYNFIQGADTQVLYDKSGNGYHGQIGSTTGADANDPTWTGTGLSFDGGDSVNCGSIPEIAITGKITVCAVFKIDSSGLGTIASKFSTNVEYLLQISSEDIIQFYVGAGSSGNSARTPTAVSVAKWYMATGLHDGINTHLYINDIKVGTAEAPVSPVADVSPLMLGKRYSDTNYLIGGLGCFSFYKIALTDREIKQNYRYLKKLMAQRGIAI